MRRVAVQPQRRELRIAAEDRRRTAGLRRSSQPKTIAELELTLNDAVEDASTPQDDRELFAGDRPHPQRRPPLGRCHGPPAQHDRARVEQTEATRVQRAGLTWAERDATAAVDCAYRGLRRRFAGLRASVSRSIARGSGPREPQGNDRRDLRASRCILAEPGHAVRRDGSPRGLNATARLCSPRRGSQGRTAGSIHWRC